MNNAEMYTSINKGVPCYLSIDLNVSTLLNECAADKVQFEQELSLIRELYRTNIIEISSYTKANEFFFENFRTITSYKNAETTIHISPVDFLKKLKEILGVKSESLDFNDKDLANILLDKALAIQHIQTPEELKEKYPLIYADYELSFSAAKKIRRYKEKNKDKLNNPETRSEIQETINRQYNLYHAFGLDTNFQNFLQKQTKLYRNLSVRRQFVEGYTNRTSIDFSMFQGLDKAKFELYVADKYLTKAISCQDVKEKQECIYYIATYIRETKTSNIKIHNDEGKEISLSSLIRRYRQFLRNNPLIRPIDEARENFKNYHQRHVENHVKKYFFTNVNWQIVPPGTVDTDFDKKVINSLNRQYNYLSPEEREKRIIERYSIYERKKAFFDNSDYLYKIYGVNAFEGYIAYIYANGEVLMEKFFDDYANCIPTKGEAIYNIKVADFETLSRKTKTALIKDKKCRRIIHTGNWEERGQEILDRPSTKTTEEQVKQLVLKLKAKKTE